jgi:hypothetical protein
MTHSLVGRAFQCTNADGAVGTGRGLLIDLKADLRRLKGPVRGVEKLTILSEGKRQNRISRRHEGSEDLKPF